MYDGAAGIGFSAPFLMIEAVAPVQPDIEPALRLGRGCGDGAPVSAEVEVIRSYSMFPGPQAKKLRPTDW